MKNTAVLLCLVLFANFGSAQPISLSANEYFNLFFYNTSTAKVYGQDSAQRSIGATLLNSLVTKSGANQLWDFSSESYTLQGVSTFVSSVFQYPGGAALANDQDFVSATHVQELNSGNPTSPIIYHFYKFNSSGLWDLGQSWDDSNGTGMKRKIITYSPQKTVMKFPVAFGTFWQEALNVKNVFLNGGTEIDSISAVIDGWGSLTTPTKSPGKNSESPMTLNLALRLKTTTIETLTIKGAVTKYNIVAYQWLTNNGYTADFGYQNGAAIPYYSGYSSAAPNKVNNEPSVTNQLKLRLSSNPAKNGQTKIIFTLRNEGRTVLKIADALGREVFSFETNKGGSGENEIPLDLSNFTNGTYFARLTADGISATQKLIVTK